MYLLDVLHYFDALSSVRVLTGLDDPSRARILNVILFKVGPGRISNTVSYEERQRQCFERITVLRFIVSLHVQKKTLFVAEFSVVFKFIVQFRSIIRDRVLRLDCSFAFFLQLCSLPLKSSSLLETDRTRVSMRWCLSGGEAFILLNPGSYALSRHVLENCILGHLCPYEVDPSDILLKSSVPPWSRVKKTPDEGLAIIASASEEKVAMLPLSCR